LFRFKLRTKSLCRHSRCKQTDFLRVFHEHFFLCKCFIADFFRHHHKQFFLKSLRLFKQWKFAFHRFLQERSRNDHPVDFICSFENTVDAGVTVDALHLVFLHEAIAAVQLDRFIYDIVKNFRSDYFVDGAFDCIFSDGSSDFFPVLLLLRRHLAIALFEITDRTVDQAFRRIQLGCHRCQLFFCKIER